MGALSPFENPPDFVNEEGVKWWRDKSLTEYARDAGILGVSLHKVSVWLIETARGYRTRIILVGDKHYFESTQMESIAVRLDVMKLAAKP